MMTSPGASTTLFIDHNVVFNPEGSSRMVRICDETNMRVISSYDKRFQVYPFRG